MAPVSSGRSLPRREIAIAKPFLVEDFAQRRFSKKSIEPESELRDTSPMRYAKDRLGQLVVATPTAAGTCPGCGNEVIARCGELNDWHWSHQAGDCDPWHEDETAWHLDWKQRAAPEYREVVMRGHRADIRLANGRVIELQRSAIGVEEIAEREQFYGDMWWLFHGDRFGKARFLREAGDRIRVTASASRTLPMVTRHMFCDLGGPIVAFPDGFKPPGIRGRLLSRSAFLEHAGLGSLPSDDPQAHSHYEARSGFTLILTPALLADACLMKPFLASGEERVRSIRHDGSEVPVQREQLREAARTARDSRAPRRGRDRPSHR